MPTWGRKQILPRDQGLPQLLLQIDGIARDILGQGGDQTRRMGDHPDLRLFRGMKHGERHMNHYSTTR